MSSRRKQRDRYHGVYPLATGIFLHLATDSERFQVSRLGTLVPPLLDEYPIIRLAAHVIRDPRTDRMFSYTAVPSLRLRHCAGTWQAMQTRKRQIAQYFGGDVPIQQRRVLSGEQVIALGNGAVFTPRPGGGWQLCFSQREGNPRLRWEQLVTLAVYILRDVWTEERYPGHFLGMLRTPKELAKFRQPQSVATKASA